MPYELVANLHIHTPYSDGEWYHAAIAQAALKAGLDFITVTDHNVWVSGVEGYHELAGRHLLLLTGEEVHDQTRQPQKNHLLVYGARAELARHAAQPQQLIDAVRDHHGLAFLAHPIDPELTPFHEPGLEWVDWDLSSYTGIELWNYMSSFKGMCAPSRSHAMRYALDPDLGMLGPFPEALALWDRLTTSGQRVVAIGNADAHGTEYRLGAIRRTIFPYEFLFTAVNTHLLVDQPLSGDLETDRQSTQAALAAGHCFVAYSRPASARGFRFSAHTLDGIALMGDQARNAAGVTFQITLPVPAETRLLRDGVEAARWIGQTHLTHVLPAGQTGVFRVEAFHPFRGRSRGWIYSNPIYIR